MPHILVSTETSDDILAKYRTPKKGAVSKLGQGAGENVDGARDPALAQNAEEEKLAPAQVEENTPFLDPANLESCFAFQDAKRKLRLVLSMCEIQPGFCQVSCWVFFLSRIQPVKSRRNRPFRLNLILVKEDRLL